jgi:broad specificity phosphatase PhoE
VFGLAIAILPATAFADAVFFLVRHAEKQEIGDDPGLNAAGKARAEGLARLLATADLGAVYSTDFRRTRQTARAVAGSRGLEVHLYDPVDPGPLLDTLAETGGRYLLVGHSNTVPDMVDRLGGEPYGAIEEQGEYDRLYVVTVGVDGEATTVLLRYGERFEP